MSAYEDLIDDISGLVKCEDADNYFNTLSYIIELMRQVDEGRFKGAKLLNIFQHKQLTIRVDYGQTTTRTKNLFGKYTD